MAKTKHQKLADLMRTMLKAIDKHVSKVAKQLNLVQLHFYEPYLLLGRPLMTSSALRKMFICHYISLQHLNPDVSMRESCRSLPMLGAITPRQVYSPAECFQLKGKGPWIVPWRVKVLLPDQSKLERGRAQAFLYCPEVDEISNQIDWFEKEMASDSLTHQLLSIGEYERRRAVVRKNLLKDPNPIWGKAKEEWQAAPTESSSPDVIYEVARDPKNVDDVDFAPKEGQSLALAYEAVMKSIRGRSCRQRQDLRRIYKEALEREMFEHVPWDEREKSAFLQKWQDNFFKKECPPASRNSGRWKQCEGLDDVKASKFIEYFAAEFIANPKNKKFGEIACVLWIFIWIAQEGEDRIGIKQVLQLTTQDIASDDAAIMKNGVEIAISWGLRNLLLCLRGRGEGTRARRLFASLDAHGKTLERALIKASKILYPEDAHPVLPAAFLIPPHIYPGIRMSLSERESMRSVKPIVPFLYTQNEIKKALLHAKKRSF